MKALSRAELAAFIDHTLLAPTATQELVVKLCDEARQHSFHGVCVYGSRVELAYAQLEDTGIKVTALIGFPFGASDSDAKRYEAEVAVDQGAHELEFMLNLGRLKDGDHAGVLREMRDIAEAADERPVKVVWEPGILTDDEERAACELALDSGVQFVGMGSGLGPAITSLEVIRLRANVVKKFGIKAAGKIRDTLTALELIEAGATRLGALDSVAIVEGLEARTGGSPAV
jgi:deoxyribose-phosphate aldolase